jgi:hypothetical protein
LAASEGYKVKRGASSNDSASALFQLKIWVGDLSRFGDGHGCSEITLAIAKTANPKIELERSTKLPLTQAGLTLV